MLAEHGVMAREYPDVRANTVSSFALNDYEWILAFEADELHRIVDLMRHLRGAEAAGTPGRRSRSTPGAASRSGNWWRPCREGAVPAAVRRPRAGVGRPGAAAARLADRLVRAGRDREHLDGADVICPSGVPVDRGLIEAGGFGWSSSMGRCRVDRRRCATEHRVWVARIAADAPLSLCRPGQAS